MEPKPPRNRIRTLPASTRPISTKKPDPARAAMPSKVKAGAMLSTGSPSGIASLSIKEAIALKRAEARKAQNKPADSSLDIFRASEDESPIVAAPVEEEDVLGRLSVGGTIERARRTGTLNLSTRALPCLPSALFEIHLGITPDPLKSVPNEPVLSLTDPNATSNSLHRRMQEAPAWFESQDLQVLKAWNNDISEIQHEISLFGSLKTVDLHQNKITSLPKTFPDLTALTVLDLSHNFLTSLPTDIFALPELTTLNLSHNTLTALPLNEPFSDTTSISKQYSSSLFFTPAVVRATTCLPRLLVFNISNNKIQASSIQLPLPANITKLDLSKNPLGPSQPLLQALGALKSLKEIHFASADLSDDSFPASLYSTASFPSLRVFDVSETAVTLQAVQAALKGMKQEIDDTEDPPVHILVGKRVLKEAWEVVSEKKRACKDKGFTDESGIDWGKKESNILPIRGEAKKSPVAIVKEPWEIEAEQGILTEGGKRRARAAAATATTSNAVDGDRGAEGAAGIERNFSAASEAQSSQKNLESTISLVNPQYYMASTQTLKLPPSNASLKPSHPRAFSVSATQTSFTESKPNGCDIAIPSPTLPLALIVDQPFAHNLKTLMLINRRQDRSVTLPSGPWGPEGFLPNLEELNLEGCNLPDNIPVEQLGAWNGNGTDTSVRAIEKLFPLISRLFPSLETLNLSYNNLSSASLTSDVLSSLILSSSGRKGLRHLRLRGSKLSELDGFAALAGMFRGDGNRERREWRLEELDIRDNDIGKLPFELGLLPLDLLLVDGNIFRVPQRRVWERKGTKGLLEWLKERME